MSAKTDCHGILVPPTCICFFYHLTGVIYAKSHDPDPIPHRMGLNFLSREWAAINGEQDGQRSLLFALAGSLCLTVALIDRETDFLPKNYSTQFTEKSPQHLP